MIETAIAAAREAQRIYQEFDQSRVDRIVQAVARSVSQHYEELAVMAVEDTGMGNAKDKRAKNEFATQKVYEYIKNKKTVGRISGGLLTGYLELAEPVGIIAGIVPVTNPTSTTLFKCLIALKTRNPIIFSFHPKALRSSIRAAALVKQYAIGAGAPEGCIGWIERPGLQDTNDLIRHPGVALVLATGGQSMVQAAYSAGKPALGVGPGNVPCYIEKTADIKQAVRDLLSSKTFDNGVICASEQTVVVDREIADSVREEMETAGMHFLSADECERLRTTLLDAHTGKLNGQIVGKTATVIAEMAGISVPANTTVLVAATRAVDGTCPFTIEKLSPILAFYVAEKDAIGACASLIQLGGLGHSAAIHSRDDERVLEFGLRVKASRVLVNSPASQGAIGRLCNDEVPSLTLGCGTMGGNSTTANINVDHLINVRRVLVRSRPRATIADSHHTKERSHGENMVADA